MMAKTTRSVSMGKNSKFRRHSRQESVEEGRERGQEMKKRPSWAQGRSRPGGLGWHPALHCPSTLKMSKAAPLTLLGKHLLVSFFQPERSTEAWILSVLFTVSPCPLLTE